MQYKLQQKQYEGFAATAISFAAAVAKAVAIHSSKNCSDNSKSCINSSTSCSNRLATKGRRSNSSKNCTNRSQLKLSAMQVEDAAITAKVTAAAGKSYSNGSKNCIKRPARQCRGGNFAVCLTARGVVALVGAIRRCLAPVTSHISGTF